MFCSRPYIRMNTDTFYGAFCDMKNNDVMLIQRILEGDESAFESLIEKYRKQVHAHAWRRTGDFHIAEDITQDTFLRVYQKLGTLEDLTQFSRWLYAIVNRLCIAWYRKNRIDLESFEETDDSDIEIDAYSRYVASEQVKTTAIVQGDVVQKLLNKLKESDRQVVTLHYFNEMTYSDIGSYLGVSESTIKSRLHRARKRLKKYEFMIQEALDITMEEGHPFHKDINGGIGMNLTFERDDLLYSLQVLHDIANGEKTSPILSNVFIHAAGNTIECMATDTEIGIRMKVQGTVKEEGKIVVSAQKLADIVKGWQSEKPINLATKSTDTIEISSGNGVSKSVKLSDAEFPQLPSVDEKAVTIDGKSLRAVIHKTGFAASTKDRHPLNGIYFNLHENKTEVVATDKVQLAIASFASLELDESSGGFLLPLKAATDITRTFANSTEIKIAQIENHILFADEHATLSTRLIKSDYPRYDEIVPTSLEGHVVVPKEPVLEATRKVSSLSDPEHFRIYLNIDAQQIRLSTKQTPRDAEVETVAVESGAGNVFICVNSRNLINVLERIETEVLAFEFSRALYPLVVKAIGEEAYICILGAMSFEE